MIGRRWGAWWMALVLALAGCGGGGSDGGSAADGRAGALAEATETWTFLADEWDAFTVDGTQTVRYGQGTTWIQKSVTGSGKCTNAFFGQDPLVGTVKRCELLVTPPPPPSGEVWTFIANEWDYFTVEGTQTVRYGQGSTWIQQNVTGTGRCSNAFFGQDPLVGIVKRCEVLETPPPPPSGEVWTFIANEWDYFTVEGTQTVRYGQGSTWIQQSVTGTGRCSNAFFGQDPLVGIVKRCEVLTGTAPPANTANAGSPLGTNLAGIVYYATEVPFVDIFKTSSPWFSGSATAWDDGRAIDVDADGWVRTLQPGQVARTLMFWGPGVYPRGKYVVLYDGSGSLEYTFGWRRVAAESGPGRDVVEATGTGGSYGLYLTATDPANPLRNIRALLPGGVCGNDVFARVDGAAACAGGNYRSFESSQATLRFNPVFLERTRQYKVLRFMDWMETNTDHQSGRWADRPRLTQARWSGQGGVPLEVMIDLANQLNAYPWLNMPHRADDDYVRNVAQVVRERLAPSLKVYVEYGNETWNPDYPAAAYGVAQAQAAGIAIAGDDYTTRIRWHARRAPQVFRLWSAAFGGHERLVRVLGGQAVSTYLTDVVAGFENAYLEADALGINAYFGLTDVSTLADAERFAALTNAQAFEEVRTNSLPALATQVRAQVAAAQGFGLKLVAFEGGNSLWPPYPARSSAALEARLDSLQRDPLMGTLYTLFLQDWFAAGGQLMMHFSDAATSSARVGWFGSMEYIEQTRSQAPKYDALMSFIETHRGLIVP